MSEMILYTAADGGIQIKVTLEDETVWLTLDQMAQLFGRDKSTVSRHIKNIFEEEELQRDSVVANFATTASDGKTYQVEHYNLDVIISVGYRVKSVQGTRFRQWAAARLKEYLIQGFTMDDERLKNLGGGSYWKELLARIKDIRSSEKVMYRQVLDLYATATDYDPQSDISKQFFQTVQNKLHYAAHGHTASEVIYYRVDSDKPFAGLTHFKGTQPTQAEAMIAKNFLEEKELRILNNLVAAYFDLAELNALEEREMRMADYLRELDKILTSTGRAVLDNAGKISTEQAKQKATVEYKKYKAKTLSEVEKAYLDQVKQIEKTAKNKGNKR
ncbi:virulence RhuM family protein [Gallibacterium anatis]|nr:virulence RhuM family protein [Gallibacterium anatis]WIM84372.1 virulence RhuM family protein [Gallibacterium anatis]